MSLPVIAAVGGAAVLGAAYIFRERLGLSRGRKPTVMVLRPNNKHFVDLPATETDLSLQTPKIKGVTRHFIKRHPGWTSDKNGDSRYFGLEGIDYTLEMKGEEKHVLTLLEAVEIALPQVDFSKFTDNARAALASAKFGITAEAVQPSSDALKNRGNENIFTESDKAMIQFKAEATAKAMKGAGLDWSNVAMGFLAGALLVYVAVNMHWLKVA